MKLEISAGELVQLQARVDRLENVLCDLVQLSDEDGPIYASDIKKRLQDAGILDKGSGQK